MEFEVDVRKVVIVWKMLENMIGNASEKFDRLVK